LSEEISEKREVVDNRDENGWQPIHEAAAGGHKKAVELLVNNGADMNTRTLGGRGGTPLHIAKKRFGPLHPVVQYLKNLGALDVPPDRSEL
jgi:prolyl 4-hydroxylase